MIKKMMGLLTGSLAFVSLASAQMAAPNQLSDQEKKDGYVLLYDGTTFTGWHSYLKKGVGSAWKSDGALYIDTLTPGATGEGAGDLITDKEYENFDLRLQWKIAPGGNSGVILPVKEAAEYDAPYETGFEMQVLDNDGHPDGKILKHRAGDLYDLIKSTSEPVHPVGEWNDAEIKLNHGKLDFYLNGVHTVSTMMWDANWMALVKASKFKKMPGFTKYKSGHISLQDHGDPVWFRSIRIRTL